MGELMSFVPLFHDKTSTCGEGLCLSKKRCRK
jgi:hypothetical protein